MQEVRVSRGPRHQVADWTAVIAHLKFLHQRAMIPTQFDQIPLEHNAVHDGLHDLEKALGLPKDTIHQEGT